MRRQRAPRLDWAGVLHPVFKVDVFACARCGDRRRVLAYLRHEAAIRRILQHLKLPDTPPCVREVVASADVPS